MDIIKNQEYPIYLRIIVNRKKAEISTKRSVKLKNWDLISSKPIKDRWLEKYLQSISSTIEQIHTRLMLEEADISAQRIKDIYQGKDSNRILLLDFIDLHVEEMKSKSDQYTPGTVKHYITLKNHLLKFHEYAHKKSPNLGKVNKEYVGQFRHYLATIAGLNNDNNLKKLRTIFNKAISLGLIDKSPLQGHKFKSSRATSITYLSKDELKSLATLEGLSTAVRQVRDVFLFSCYTGLRYSDIEALKPRNLIQREGREFIEIQIKKTQTYYLAPLLKEAKEILNKYLEIRELTGKLLPVISNQKSNSTLKFIANLAGIDKKLSMHVGRHTFATGALSAGVPLEVVSRWLGHSDLKTTQVYAKITNDYMVENAELMNKKLYI